MNLKKLKKRFYRQEKIRLHKKIFKIRVIVNEVLQENFNRRLYNLRHDDELRLLTLFVWRDRYKVSIKWMLKILIPIWSKRFARFKVKSSLGCRVATLVGKKSEEIIREKIWKEFPNEENKQNWYQSEKERISDYVIRHDTKRNNSTKYRSILDAPNPKLYIKQYKKELRWKSKTSSKSNKELKEIQKKSFRMNPWME